MLNSFDVVIFLSFPDEMESADRERGVCDLSSFSYDLAVFRPRFDLAFVSLYIQPNLIQCVTFVLYVWSVTFATAFVCIPSACVRVICSDT